MRGANVICRVVIVLLGSTLCVVSAPIPAQAVGSPDWTAPGDATVNYKVTSAVLNASNRDGCVEQTIKVRHLSGTLDTIDDQKTCVVAGKYVSIADTYWGIAISSQSDRNFYLMSDNSGIRNIQLMPGGDRVGIVWNINGRHSVSVYDNFALRLKFQANILRYKLVDQTNALFPVGKSGIGGAGGVSIALSNNGSYAVYQQNDDYPGQKPRLIRVDLRSGDAKQFGRLWYGYYASSIPRPHFAISNDGTSIVGGGPALLKFWRVNASCLTEIPNYLDGTMEGDCPNRVVQSSYIGEPIDSQSRNGIARLSFNNTATELSFIYYKPNEYKRVNISPPGYSPSGGLDYLALGDSYSSGEGDVGVKADGSSYYTPETADIGGCHLSTRSYPFLLRDEWGIPTGKMRSVACSGAKVLPDYDYPLSGYYGQGASPTTNDQTQKQEQALNNFTPGIIPQFEFIKKYQPKVITLTGGGNDIGFADIVEYCALPNMSTGIPIPYTCEYAKAGSTLNVLLRQSVDTQAIYMRRLLFHIREASPNSRVIVVGYPQFISYDSSCSLNSGFLDLAERATINATVTLLNSMLKSEAARAGFEYADIENSLEGGRLCEGSEYVNGAFSVGLDIVAKDKRKRTPLFHPNALGHQTIADRIVENIIPPNPEVVADNQDFDMTKQVDFLASSIVRFGSMISSTLPMHSFAPGSMVSATGYSSPTPLGTFLANEDGSFDATLDVSTLAPGMHVVVLDGMSSSGAPVYYYQFVTIAVNEHDVDGDGILDTNDRCSFIANWYDEATGVDTCAENIVEENTPVVATQSGNVSGGGAQNSANVDIGEEIGVQDILKQNTPESTGSDANTTLDSAVETVNPGANDSGILQTSTTMVEKEESSRGILRDAVLYGALLGTVGILVARRAYAKKRQKRTIDI